MMKYKIEKYTKKKGTPEAKDVEEEVMLLAKKDVSEEGIGIKDVIIGKFKFAPFINRDLEIKQGQRKGQKFSTAKGVFTWENVTSEDESHLNQWGNLKIDFTRALKDYDFKKINWEEDKVAFYLRPYVKTIDGKDVKEYAVAVDRIRSLSADEIEAVLELQKDKESYTETELKVEFEDNGATKILNIPRWALLLTQEELVALQGE